MQNGEDLAATLRRECMEEANARISVGDVVFMRDYIEDNHEFAGNKPGFHQVEIMFTCKILNPDEVAPGETMDDRQIGITWLPVASLTDFHLYPQALKPLIQRVSDGGAGAIYIGDVN